MHRYMTASPGCWRIYGELMAGGLPATPMAGLAVDAYAVTHPGTPGPQSTPSVWIHLITLCAVIERGWRVDQAIRLRRVAAEAPLASARLEEWVNAAWSAWDVHAAAVRDRVADLSQRFFD